MGTEGEVQREGPTLLSVTEGDSPSFHCFPDLPTEIRWKIWALSFPSPQKHGPPGTHGYKEKVRIIPKNPVALFVNQDSRAVALQHYTLRDPCELAKNRSYKEPQASYMDFQRDLFVIPEVTCYFSLVKNIMYDGIFYGRECTAADLPAYCFEGRPYYFSLAEMGSIAHVELTSGDFYDARRDIGDWLHNWLPIFTELKSLTYAILHPEDGHMLMGDRYKSWNNEVWSVKEKVAEYEEAARDIMGEFGAKRLAEGKRWQIADFKVDMRISPHEEYLEYIRKEEARHAKRRLKELENAGKEKKGKKGKRGKQGQGSA